MTGPAPSLFEAPPPRWRSIDAHRPFLPDLARVLFDALGRDDPDRLSQAVIMTPNRRAARALADAFVAAASGRAVLLPQIRALGDLEEGEAPFEPGDLALDLPPAVSPMQRRFELAAMIREAGASLEGRTLESLGLLGALTLADALAAFIDSAAIEEIRVPSDPASLVTGEQARHWAASATALRIATELWPRRLETLGLIDVAERRTRLLNALADRWTTAPPATPLIAAGSTGSAPAAARLLSVIAAAPAGLVVLPGLDRELADRAWDSIGEDHPQFAMRRLLATAGVSRGDVGSWPTSETSSDAARGRARRRVISEALRPAATTDDWVRQIEAIRSERPSPDRDPVAEGMEGLTLVTARVEDEAAAVIALLMRKGLETPGRTVALVTPDVALSRRVSARLARWGIDADSSAGRPLAETPIGVLIGLLIHHAAVGFSPATLLAILKQPLSRIAVGADAALRVLERRGLRGPRPRGFDGLRARLARRREPGAGGPPESADRVAERDAIDAALELVDALDGVVGGLRGLFADGEVDAVVATRGLVQAIEALAGEDVWTGQAAEAAALVLSELLRTAAVLGPVTAVGFERLVADVMAGATVRPDGAPHPRLQILGAIEARLVRADRIILAGLEEGVWPRLPAADPFFSRPMRARLGLPAPERRIGLSAHDFAQAACAPDVVMVTCDRRGGQPAVRSRWLWRLETLARGANAPATPVEIPSRPELLAWARALDTPLSPPPPDLERARRPEPRPPLAARPTALPVTGIETWVRDPYALYARTILKLRPLDPPDAPMDARARGTAIHRAFEHFARSHETGAPEQPELLFQRLLEQALREEGVSEAAMARELALARRLSGWAAGFERDRRSAGARVLVEVQGAHSFEVDGARFTVTAKADRIEIDGDRFHVLDFKTGQAPTAPQIKAGFSPQLTLTAAILSAGGFEGVSAREVGDLAYVRVTGRRVPGETITPLKTEAGAVAERTLAGLKARVQRFQDVEQPYRSWTAPQFLSDRGRGDYDHLARVYEWRVAGGGEGGGE